jgi:hypothetical protein
MVWSEYLQYQNTEQLEIEENEPETPQWEVVEFNTWVDWYEPHLSNMWNDFTVYRQDAGISGIVFQGLDYWDWCHMLYDRSDKRAIPID